MWLDRLCRWGIAIFFLVAAVPKLLDPSGFAAVIGAYGLLPKPLLVPVAVVLPLLEIALAAGLLWNRLPAKIGIALLLLLFIAVLAYAITQGLAIDCGCFGPDDPERRAFHDLQGALVRDFALLLPLAYSFWWHRSCNTFNRQRRR